MNWGDLKSAADTVRETKTIDKIPVVQGKHYDDGSLSKALNSQKMFGVRRLRADRKTPMRCSGIYSQCPRAAVFERVLVSENGPTEYFIKPDFRSFMRMETGTMFHEFLQDHVFGPLGVLYGEWESESGIHEGFYDETKEKQHFIEETFYDEDLFLSGHTDGKVCMERVREFLDGTLPSIEDLVLFEIKTAGGFPFKKALRKELPPYYTWQATAYQHLSGILVTLFFYWNRDTAEHCSFIYEGTGDILTQVLKKSALVKKCCQSCTLPERTCMTPADGKGCPFRDRCFLAPEGKEFTADVKDPWNSEVAW